MNKAEQLFIKKAVKREGIFLYPREIALEFIKTCQNENIHLLGIDGFLLINDCIQPSMADSVDFSSLSFEGDVYKKAIAFLEARPEDMFFEIICN